MLKDLLSRHIKRETNDASAQYR